MAMIVNPILPGFNPDPCICRNGGDYYIATSTFEWFPGVQIHHSKDLVKWELIGHPLDRVSQLDMRGTFPSGGVWAPALTYADGLFWLVYTNVQSFVTPTFDTPNYLVTAENINGPWSEPVYLNSSGFDPSLFHDDDGRKYLVNMAMAEIGAGTWFGGLLLQEYDVQKKELVGPVKNIWENQTVCATEGPHILKRDGWYYLIAAEGGTGLTHKISVTRSCSVWGPYELSPDNPIITASEKPDTPLTSCGHGNFIETPSGDWYMVHLCTRGIPHPGVSPEPYTDNGRYQSTHTAVLGRETAIQRIQWGEDGWPRMLHGNTPALEVEVAGSVQETPADAWDTHETFDGETWSIHFNTLREPADEAWVSLKRKPGALSLRGRNSLFSWFDQSLLARRLQHIQNVTVETCVAYKPEFFQQAAGLIVYTDYKNFKYLRITSAGAGLVKIGVVNMTGSSKGNRVEIVDSEPLAMPEKVWMRATVQQQALRFFWSLDGMDWNESPKVFNITELGNWVRDVKSEFTGTFCGVCCQDTWQQKSWAEFDFFRYTGR